jgi:hypothetical protein
MVLLSRKDENPGFGWVIENGIFDIEGVGFFWLLFNNEVLLELHFST